MNVSFIFYFLFTLGESSIFANIYANNKHLHDMGRHRAVQNGNIYNGFLAATLRMKDSGQRMKILGQWRRKTNTKRQNRRLKHFLNRVKNV